MIKEEETTEAKKSSQNSENSQTTIYDGSITIPDPLSALSVVAYAASFPLSETCPQELPLYTFSQVSPPPLNICTKQEQQLLEIKKEIKELKEIFKILSDIILELAKRK